MNWSDLPIFLAVARAGSFTAAAAALGVNQSTVSRRVSALERDLSARLFLREGDSRRLTPAGEELLARAEAMETGAADIERRVAGRDARLAGRLRLTCVEMMAARWLAPHLAAFMAAHPEIDLEVATAFQPLDLGREADVAIRVSAEPPASLVGRRLFDFAFAAYAASGRRDELAAEPPERLPWLGLTSDEYNRVALQARFPGARPRKATDGLFALAALCRAGAGPAALPCYWADRESGLARLWPEAFNPAGVGVWVMVHPDMRHMARARALRDFLTARLLADRALFAGGAG